MDETTQKGFVDEEIKLEFNRQNCIPPPFSQRRRLGLGTATTF